MNKSSYPNIVESYKIIKAQKECPKDWLKDSKTSECCPKNYTLIKINTDSYCYPRKIYPK